MLLNRFFLHQLHYFIHFTNFQARNRRFHYYRFFYVNCSACAKNYRRCVIVYLIESIDHGIIVSKTHFSSEETEHRGNDGIGTVFRLCSCLEDFFYRLDFFCFYYTNTFGMDIHTFNVFDVKLLLLVFFLYCVNFPIISTTRDSGILLIMFNLNVLDFITLGRR